MFVLLFVALIVDQDEDGLAAWPLTSLKNNLHAKMAVPKLRRSCEAFSSPNVSFMRV
jgi:hypothetical protein